MNAMDSPILYVLGSYPMWSETFLRQDLQFLLAEKVPLVPVCLFHGDIPLREGWPDVTCLGMGGGAAKRATSNDAQERLGRWLPRRLRTRLSLSRHRRALNALKKQATAHGATHIHAEFADLPGLLAAKAARDLGLGHSLGIHARDAHLAKYDPRLLYNKARFVISCNEAARDAVLAQSAAVPERMHLIPHGLDLTEWPFRETAAGRTGACRLLFVGRFVDKKGIDTLVHAVRLLADREVDVRLTLVGDGPLQLAMRALATDLGVDSLLSWAGIVDRPDVLAYLYHADCLVVPSRVARDGDRDGIPNVLLEAMASGTPVAGTQVGGLGEVLSERTGWVVEADDPETLADTIQALGRRQAETDARRAAARKLVERRFDARRLARKRARLFLNAVSDTP